MPDKQNKKYTQFIIPCAKIPFLEGANARNRKYKCSGSFPSPGFQVFVNQESGDDQDGQDGQDGQ